MTRIRGAAPDCAYLVSQEFSGILNARTDLVPRNKVEDARVEQLGNMPELGKESPCIANLITMPNNNR
jgi:hypothetical protein